MGAWCPTTRIANEPCYYFDPAKCLFIGGQFNGAGGINRRLADYSEAVRCSRSWSS